MSSKLLCPKTSQPKCVFLHVRLNSLSLKMKCIVISINESRDSLILWCPIAVFGEFAKGIFPLVI